MTSLSETETNSALSLLIICICVILCLYMWWIGMYEYSEEFTLGALLISLGILYASILLLIKRDHPYIASVLIFCTLAIVIAIAAVSGMKQKDGTQGDTFLALGATPLVSAICFTFCAASIINGIASTNSMMKIPGV